MILCVMIRPARQYSAHFFDRLCPRIAYRKALCLPDVFVIRFSAFRFFDSAKQSFGLQRFYTRVRDSKQSIPFARINK